MEKTPEWLVCTFGGPEEESFEISVIRSNNLHGMQSYGWFGEDKLLISHNDGPCNWPVTKEVWDMLLNVAALTAKRLNLATTPKCKCGSNENWVIGRQFEERRSWNPETRELQDRHSECTELWIFCSSCGYNANCEDDEDLYELLEKA